MNKIELLIFDMDGLMFDTGRLAYRAYLESAKKHDFEVTHNVYYYLTGRTEKGIRQHMEELYGNDVSHDEWRDSINMFKDEILAHEKRVYKKKGLVDLLEFTKNNGIKIAIASSSDREKVNYYLEIEGISEYFDIIIAGDEVINSKPDPEIFLSACKKSEITCSNAIVLEDSAAGIEAAHSAGIVSFLVEDDITYLPTRKGHHKLKKDLSRLKEKKVPADYQFLDLLQVRDFLEKTKNTEF
ncbi:haloacid dehalogenase superfamily, subfamily IA, variant 3 with third motif having DD or ED/haloacid dehalogenase superfamily, subfamily IA, variant 1 with third motif having Dx(3-4)D or Dx(3-4)E [Carnobacterium iners]|uniref:Haloacid dehalogenase superfamily, subfamily IA, variant 3 with third motif having DD or ED/haloacid dehalogenase superfamily, subfamily IA, variant 1 with third motif having Dx(3-4)D or Dx(3-4)E n=1 Tax=Carnobacterium iners TaxID=1073423 RepID=A0A1X7MVF5_9LACT|nr:HAD family phosphatase [Carnobacterium iners]SEL06277.1 haloacid dehalogenase superfamily, subfamily IA, variant 3 with third motif having DD or ED/haloacid dehalogenase superfamily, subfamily IA, variant 1 with third motif having Dx(3-4)D or Dx(3-4)E [Carnobacterium iners]SMH27976.1 haloacid dehalogenase superfamily, subfamily IA, variant 3 with third motif having DD or ED/haloacid dehalogenase superfamily, subfamily IA, variant 1 with third motif having Dx(3-4)D or Dx(3-4)E [Carnobacterium i